jgi:hypothetical protein
MRSCFNTKMLKCKRLWTCTVDRCEGIQHKPEKRKTYESSLWNIFISDMTHVNILNNKNLFSDKAF